MSASLSRQANVVVWLLATTVLVAVLFGAWLVGNALDFPGKGVGVVGHDPVATKSVGTFDGGKGVERGLR